MEKQAMLSHAMTSIPTAYARPLCPTICSVERFATYFISMGKTRRIKKGYITRISFSRNTARMLLLFSATTQLNIAQDKLCRCFQ